MNIKSISFNLFSSNKNENSNQSNPFGKTFKGNLLTADIFDKKSDFALSPMNKFAQNIAYASKKIISFGNKMKSGVSDFWQKANDISIEIDFEGAKNLLKSKLAFKGNEFKVENLVKRPVSELETMMKQEMGV